MSCSVRKIKPIAPARRSCRYIMNGGYASPPGHTGYGQRGNRGLWNQSVGDCRVTSFLAMTAFCAHFDGVLIIKQRFFNACALIVRRRVYNSGSIRCIHVRKRARTPLNSALTQANEHPACSMRANPLFPDLLPNSALSIGRMRVSSAVLYNQ